MKRLAAHFLVLTLASASSFAQVVGEIRPGSSVALTGGTVTIGIDITTGPGVSLGSYGAALEWDPALLQYDSDTSGGQPPFDTALVNRTSTAAGRLSFSDASPGGGTGRINVLNVTFRVLVQPPGTATFDLELTSLFSSGSFQDLRPSAIVNDGSTCAEDLVYDLVLSNPAGTVLSWVPIGGGQPYAVIRGMVDQLSADGLAVHLGFVTCLEISGDTTTGAGAEPANPDTAVPPLNRAFFYQVRTQTAGSTYGFADNCTMERVVDGGDCP
ncbi:MAG: cohesin domain-containing protein [Candidatus Polarisedimenticolia bacterium]